MEQQKFTEEELQKIRDLQKEFTQLLAQMGQLTSERYSLDRLENEMKLKYNKLRDRESILVGEFSKKYGDGTLDIETGTFSPLK